MVLPKPGRREHVVVGNINIDISLKVDRFPRPDENLFASDAWIGPGGAASNYAIAVARLGHRPRLIARAGDDAYRLGILDYLRLVGVVVDDVVIARGENTGTVVVIVVPKDSTRTMLTVRGANEGLTGSMVPDRGDLVHFASVKGVIVEDAASVAGSRKASYDPGGEVYRDPLGVAKAARLVEVLILNELEASRLSAAIGTTVSNLSSAIGGRLELVIVKLGKGGAVAYINGEKLYVKPCRPKRLVDATGAGDAFDAALNYCLLEGCDLETSLKVASAAGSAKVARRGSSNMPERSEIEELYESCYGRG